MINMKIWAGLLGHVALVMAQVLPSLDVTLAPIFDGSAVVSLNVTLKIKDTRIKANKPILSIDWPRYGEDNPLVASDSQGALPINLNPFLGIGVGSWSVSRDPVGDITVNMIADPHANVSGVSGRGDLRYDQGGVFGSGHAFIPSPPADEKWNITVSWNIPESAPAGTHFTSSFGGDDLVGTPLVGVPAKTLANTFFAVGRNLQRWPSWDNNVKHLGGHEFAAYWMGSLPWESAQIGPMMEDIFNGTANYFKDADSPFRLFFRRDFESYGGVGGFQSFLMEYTQDSEEENSLDALICLISHEIIHNYALLWPDETYDDNWYTEGIADYLGIISPFLSGAITREHWIQWMNDEAQDYYTGSPVSRNWDVVVANYWSMGTANIKTAYTRGFMYLAYVQGLIHDATNGTHSIDDVILPMYQLYRTGEDVAREQFLQLVGSFIGRDAADTSFELMRNGTTLVPSKTAFAKHGIEMVRQDQPMFSTGMSENSFGNGEVTGLIPGSRAEQAGLKDGDKIVSSWGLWGLMDTLDSKMRIVVLRDGKEMTFEYWPRSVDTVVEAWHWVEAKEKSA